MTGHASSEDMSSSYYVKDNGKLVYLDFIFGNNDMIVEITPNREDAEKIEIVTDWISSKLDYIKDIGWETLITEGQALNEGIAYPTEESVPLGELVSERQDEKPTAPRMKP